MLRWLFASALLALATPAVAAPSALFSGTLTADASAAAPLGATASLASPNDPGGGGVITGDVGVITPSAGTLAIALQDLGAVGDVYEVILDGMSLGLTTPVPVGGPTNSTGLFSAAVGTGFHDIGVWDPVLTYQGATSPYGGMVTGTSSDFSLTVGYAAVPEAPSLVLLATALGLLGVSARRRTVRG